MLYLQHLLLTGISATTLYSIIQKNSMPDVDNLLTSFYQLDDEARKEVVETIQFKLQYHRDPEHAEQIKGCKLSKKHSQKEHLERCSFD